jgi:hypothetical protein
LPRSRELLRTERRALDEPGAALLAQAEAVAADGKDVAVVQEAVENGRRDHRIAEHAPPFADRSIAGDQETAALVAPRDELKEEMRRIGLERQIAEFVTISSLGLA